VDLSGGPEAVPGIMPGHPTRSLATVLTELSHFTLTILIAIDNLVCSTYLTQQREYRGTEVNK